MDFIPFDIYNYEIAGYAALALLAVVLSVVTIRRKAAISHNIADNAFDADEVVDEQLPPMSVVVLIDACDALTAEETIPEMMGQDYPDFEIIAVDTDKSGVTDDVLTRLSLRYPNLRTTYIPNSSSNVSKRKLAITLGIKAAKNDVVLITSGRCRPQSAEWLKAMGRHFDDYTDVVIGYSRPDFKDDFHRGRRLRAFDVTAEAVRYLAAAIHGKAYRACGRNVAYRKSLFLAAKGFASTLNLKYGDDDIFISEIAGSDNTAVELSPESILTEHTDGFPSRRRMEKEQHLFTAKFLPGLSNAVEHLRVWAYRLYLLLVASGVAYPVYLFLGNPMEWLKPVALLSVGLALYLTEVSIYIRAYRVCARLLQSPRLLCSLPPLRFVRPMVDEILSTKARRGANYTWQ